MKGALIELLARGKQDKLFITENPDINKFRNVYKKMNNYVRFECEQTLSTTADFGQTVICDIEKKGDLLTNCMLEIKLPATGSINTSWVNSIGLYIIKEVRLKIGGIIIDKFTPEYMDAYFKHSVNLGRYASFAEMVKNISGYRNNSNTTENTLYVPLPFWFSKSIGDALPLISLNYMDVKIEIDFKTLSDCLYNGTTSISVTGLNIISCKLYTEMVYLPKEERIMFLKTKEFDYLIEQKQFHIFTIDDGDINKNIKFNFNNPVKELLWIYRDNYYKNRHLWDKFTLFNGVNDVEPIKNVGILFNGLDRINKRSGGYFRLVQPFLYHTSTVSDFYYFYSFCDNPDDIQPSGYVNMSLIDNSQLQIEFDSDINAGELYLYAINYNHLKIKNGMAGLLYH